jgi:hypothetical protein
MTIAHLDDEALSAAIDGESTAEEQTHMDGCAACRERIDQLRMVASAVGTPVPSRPAAATDAAIMAALTATSEREAIRPATAAAPSPIGLGRRHTGRELGPRSAQVVLAAAAVVVVLLGVGLLLKGGGSSSKTSSVAERSQPAAPGFASTNPASGGAAGAVPSTISGLQAPSVAQAPVRGPSVDANLGDQTDAAVLAQLVKRRLAVSSTTSSSADLNAKGAGVPSMCVDQAAAAAGMAGQNPVLRYVAPVRWQGQNATVLVFDRPGGLAGVVMRLPDCATLTTLPL